MLPCGIELYVYACTYIENIFYYYILFLWFTLLLYFKVLLLVPDCTSTDSNFDMPRKHLRMIGSRRRYADYRRHTRGSYS